MKLNHDFEHQVWGLLKAHQLHQHDSYIVAVSGGVDSMALLEVILQTRPSAKIKVLHYHHGLGNDDFRDRASALIAEICTKHSNVEFVTEKSDQVLQSENEMRQARWGFIRRHRNLNEPILTAHHLDDWVETFVLKMIRGASAEGVKTFKIWNQEIFRPFLEISKSEIVAYAKVRNVRWIDDPTNQSEDYLRNWVRESWLKQLDQKSPGAYHNFSISLLNIQRELEQNSHFEVPFFNDTPGLGLDRNRYNSLSSPDQLKALAMFLKSNNVHHFTRGQLEEIQKRLDKNQKELNFEIIRKWVINASQIMIA